MSRAPTRVSTPRWLSLALVVALPSACRGKQDTSSLAKRADETKSAASVAAAEAKPSPVTPPPVDSKAPFAAPANAERVALWIDLDPAKPVRVLTVGMLELPLVNQPTGFAREETLTFRDCDGDGAARQCVVEHAGGRFAAEPPTGRILEQDEKRFIDVRSHHLLDAHGRKQGDATVVGPPGPPDFADTDLGRSLVGVHRFACIRLPNEPVGIGAKWSDSCSLLFGGQLARQDVAWELTALSDDPISGTRAELTMIGRLTLAGENGDRVGTIEGKLYFFVDAHAPHILRLRARVPLSPGQKTESTTTLNLQYGHVDPKGVVTRTDGQPLLPAGPVVAPEAPATPGTAPTGSKAGDAPPPTPPPTPPVVKRPGPR